MPPQVERLMFDFGITDGRGSVLNLTINYAPVISGVVRSDLADHFTLPSMVRDDEDGMKAYADLAVRCERLRDQLESIAMAMPEEIELEGKIARVAKVLSKLWIFAEGTPVRLQADFRQQFGSSVERVAISYSGLTEGGQRLLDSVLATVDSFCWRHIRHRFGMASTVTRPQVFISYRQGQEVFAEALAMRLGREGFEPWFDKWEVLAGDSLPGKVEEGLRKSIAFIAVITSDFSQGRWATEELESAIHRRVEEGYPIIPVLLDDCDTPSLIRHLVYVDFRNRDPQTFEAKVAEVIDGINRLDRNPFR